MFLNIDSLQRIILAVAQPQRVESVLQMIVRGLAEECDVALTRIWLVAPGDICTTCHVLNECPNQTRCLHLAVSAGNPLAESSSLESRQEDWTRVDGHFRRIPLNGARKVGYVGGTGQPVLVQIPEAAEKDPWIARPDWVKAQGIRSFAGQPLTFNGEVLGVLAVFSRAELTEREFGWLRTFADHAAVAIGNARTFEEVSALNASVAAGAERWRSVFENSAIGVALTDLNGRFLATNPVYQKMLGYTEEELRAFSFLDVTHEDYCESNWALAAELLEGKREQFQIEKQYRRKDGSLIWVRNNVSLVPGSESVPRFIMALSEDITERKQAEDALRDAEEFKTRLIACSEDCIKVLDLEGRLLSMNEGGMQALEICDLAPVVNSSWIDFWKGEDREAAQAAVEAARDGRTGRFTGYFATTVTNQARWWDVLVSPIRDAEGKPERLLAVSRDITERKKAEETLRKSEQRKRSLLEINNAIITSLTKDALLQAICEALQHVLHIRRAALILYEPSRDTLRMAALVEEPHSDFFHVGVEIDRKNSLSGWVFDHRQPLLRSDLETEWKFPSEQRLLQEGIRSACLVPLIVGGKSIGTLNVASRTKNQYSESDLEFLQEVANQVALAVENMRSYEEIAALKARLEKENVYLQEEIRAEHNFEEIVGNSPVLLAVLRKVEQVAPTDSSVLIYGETGTGKELIARAIHNRSSRKGRALVRVNCTAISAGLVESELFGHLKGAFTGAIERRVGRFELADGGTIFLDEIGELPLETQVKLLRVLQEQEFEPVGSSRPLRVDVRVIAATNRNLREAIEVGRFRSDLFYRLDVFPIELPPLRERRSDIPQLAAFYVSRFAARLGKKVESLSQESMNRLMSYSWPGNVRELQNVMERAVVLSSGPTLWLDKDLVPVAPSKADLETPETTAPKTPPASLTSSRLPTLEELERSHILAALQRAGGVVNGPKGAATILNLHPNTLRHRMGKLGIKGSGHRPS